MLPASPEICLAQAVCIVARTTDLGRHSRLVLIVAKLRPSSVGAHELWQPKAELKDAGILNPSYLWLLQSARSCLLLRHHRPIVLAFAMRDRTDEAIAPDIAARQRHADRSAGGEREIGVFQSEHGALPGWLIALLGDDLAVDLVSRAGEQAVGHHIEKNFRCDVI